MKQKLPVHDFNSDDARSIPFKIIPLERKSAYDTAVPHRHNYYEVFFFLNGSGVHFIDFENFDISSSSIHFVSPGQVHMVQRGLGSYGYVILFSREFYYMNLKNHDLLYDLPFLNNNTPRPILDLSNGEFKEFLDIVEKIENEYSANDHMSLREEIIRSYLNILLIKSKRYFEDRTKPYSHTNNHRHLYQRFRILLENNFTTLHKPSDYAGMLGISEKHLNEVAQSIIGKSITKLIHERLLLEIKRLSLYSDLSFKEIGYLMGFSDPAYFARFFKKKSGITLSDFRNKYHLLFGDKTIPLT